MIAAIISSACSRPEPKALPLFTTPRWSATGDLSLRVAGSELLLQHQGSAVLYVYDRQARTLHEADASRWTKAEGATVDCSGGGRPLSTAWRIDPQAGLLRGNTPQRLAGDRPLLLRLSPSGQWLSALSTTAGGDSLLPAIGSAPAQGPLWHEVLFAVDGKSAGGSVRLPTELGRTLILACWSPDERDVVYHDQFFTKISIASFVSPKKEHP
jgi:hypothetical protein